MTSMTELELRDALRQSIVDRASLYLHLYRELRRRVGEPQAVEILSAAVFERGRELGAPLRRFAPNDFRGLCDAFAYAPDGGQLFAPIVHRCDEQELDLEMGRCPLKEAWQAAGATDAELVTLTHIASALDKGTMSEAGFDVSIRTWQPGVAGCCRLSISERRSPNSTI